MADGVWEHQRSFIRTRWGQRLLKGDPPAWVTADGQETTPITRGYQKVISAETDSEGWMYAADFQAAQWSPEWSRHLFVRRRNWVPVDKGPASAREPRPAPLSARDPPLTARPACRKSTLPATPRDEPVHVPNLGDMPYLIATTDKTATVVSSYTVSDQTESTCTLSATSSSASSQSLAGSVLRVPRAESPGPGSRLGSMVFNEDELLTIPSSSLGSFNLARPSLLPKEKGQVPAAVATYDPNGSLRYDPNGSLRYSMGSVPRTFGFNLEATHFLLDGSDTAAADDLEGILQNHADTVEKSQLSQLSEIEMEGSHAAQAVSAAGVHVPTLSAGLHMRTAGETLHEPTLSDSDMRAALAIEVEEMTEINSAREQKRDAELTCVAMSAIRGHHIQSPEEHGLQPTTAAPRGCPTSPALRGFPASPALQNRTCSQLSATVYYMEGVRDNDVPDTVFTMDAFTRAQKYPSERMESENRTQNEDALWLDQQASLMSMGSDTIRAIDIPTVVSNDSNNNDNSDLLRVETVHSFPPSARGTASDRLDSPRSSVDRSGINSSGPFLTLDTEPALSDEEGSMYTAQSDLWTSPSKPGVHPPQPSQVAVEVPTVIPHLLVLRVLQASPLPRAAAYVVQAQLGLRGGWSQTSPAADATWCQDLVLCETGQSHTDLHLCVYAIDETADPLALPQQRLVGVCEPVPQSALASLTSLQLPLRDVQGAALPDDPCLSLIVARGQLTVDQEVEPKEQPEFVFQDPVKPCLPDLAELGILPGASVAREPITRVSSNVSCPQTQAASAHGPPRIEVTVVSAENLFTTEDLAARPPEALEVCVALGLPAVSRGWYRTAARGGNYPAWGQPVALPVLDAQNLGVLEVQLHTVKEARFLGQALVPLHGLQQDTVTTFKVKMGVVAESGTLLAVLGPAPRELYLKICPRHFDTEDINNPPNANYSHGWTYDAEQQHSLLRQYADSCAPPSHGPPLQQRDYLKGDSPCILQLLVQGACDLDDAVRGHQVFLQLQVGDTDMETQMADAGSSCLWNEEFLVELGIRDTPTVNITCFWQHNESEELEVLGCGTLDVAKLPWHKGDQVEYNVRILSHGQLVATIALVLNQRPAGAIQWLLWMQDECMLLLRECDRACQLGISLEAEERQQLVRHLEAACRTTTSAEEQQEWELLHQQLAGWKQQLQLLLQMMCTVRIKMVKTCRLYLLGDCYLILELGGQKFTTSARCPTSQGIIMWTDECTLKNSGRYEGNAKILQEPLHVSLWYQGHHVGGDSVDLTQLHWRQQQPVTITLTDGSQIVLLLEALDFGLAPQIEDEEPTLELTVLRAVNLPCTGDKPQPHVVLNVPGCAPQQTASLQGCDPVWNKGFAFRLPKSSPVQCPAEAELQLYDQETKLGSLKVPLGNLIRDQPVVFRLGLRVVAKGVEMQDSHLHVRVCARGFGEALPPSARRSSAVRRSSSPCGSPCGSPYPPTLQATPERRIPASSVVSITHNSPWGSRSPYGSRAGTPTRLEQDATRHAAPPPTIQAATLTAEQAPCALLPAAPVCNQPIAEIPLSAAPETATSAHKPDHHAQAANSASAVEVASPRPLQAVRPAEASEPPVLADILSPRPAASASIGVMIAAKALEMEDGEACPQVVNVRASGPAEKAGMLPGDAIMAWNGTRLRSREDFAAMLKQAVAGHSVSLHILRGTQQLHLDVVPAASQGSGSHRHADDAAGSEGPATLSSARSPRYGTPLRKCSPQPSARHGMRSPQRSARHGMSSPQPSARHGMSSPQRSARHGIPKAQARTPRSFVKTTGAARAPAAALGDISNL